MCVFPREAITRPWHPPRSGTVGYPRSEDSTEPKALFSVRLLHSGPVSRGPPGAAHTGRRVSMTEARVTFPSWCAVVFCLPSVCRRDCCVCVCVRVCANLWMDLGLNFS